MKSKHLISISIVTVLFLLMYFIAGQGIGYPDSNGSFAEFFWLILAPTFVILSFLFCLLLILFFLKGASYKIVLTSLTLALLANIILEIYAQSLGRVYGTIYVGNWVWFLLTAIIVISMIIVGTIGHKRANNGKVLNSITQ